jgi:hypothetical protein
MTGMDVPEPVASGVSTAGNSDDSMVLTVEMTGNRAMVEDVILEVRALALELGLEIPDVAVIREPTIVPKAPLDASDVVGNAERNGSELA